MAQIHSLNHARIKQIRALAQRAERDRTGLFFVEGIRNVVDAIQWGATIELLVVAPDLLVNELGRETARRQRREGTPCMEVGADIFKSMSAGISLKYGPQGLGAVVRQRWKPLAPVLRLEQQCWIGLDAIQDPGNLGTILRTCDAAGAAGVMLIGRTTDPYDPVAVRASLGAVFSQTLIRTNIAEFAAWKRESGCYVVGTSGAAPSDYRSTGYAPPLVLLMGSERSGLSSELQALCDAMVRIPMVGRGESLNVAVATGIMLYEILHRRHVAPPMMEW